MKLSVGERLQLLALLPSEGEITSLKILRKLRESLSFSEEEHRSLNLTQSLVCKDCLYEVVPPALIPPPRNCPKCDKPLRPGGRMYWNRSVEQERELEIGEKAKSIIVKALISAYKKLNKEEKLNDSHLGLFGKFSELDLEIILEEQTT